MISTAQRHAERISESFMPYLDADCDVVIEPSDIAIFRSEYGKILDPADFKVLRDGSYALFEYLYGIIENHPAAADLIDQLTFRTALAYHSHCQQRTQGLDAYTTAVLERAGFDVARRDIECCGMAGSFGYASEYYDLSIDIGSDLSDQMQQDTVRAVTASGTSCIQQLEAPSQPASHTQSRS